MGDALLSTGLYRVALKKLTTPTTRPFAFACSYAVSNLAGALADVVVDKMRSGLTDIYIYYHHRLVTLITVMAMTRMKTIVVVAVAVAAMSTFYYLQ